MRLYKKVKQITNLQNISPQSKGVIVVAQYNDLNVALNNTVEIKNYDGTSFTVILTLYPAQNIAGLSNISENLGSYSIIPFNVKGITFASGAVIKAYELF